VSDPTVSFVVLSYNFDRFLAECVDSILKQDGRHDFEVIVVDDASSDTTTSILAGFRDSRIRVIRHPHNQGHVATVNEALSLARGRYVARIDGDDRYRPGFLNTVIPLLDSHPDVALVYGDVSLMDASGRINAATSDRAHAKNDFKGNELVALLEENFICAPTVIARREAWQECLPVPDGLAFHDWYFTVMMARRHDFCYVNRVLADYRIHGANHHTRIVRDKTEEPSIFGLLDRVFREVELSAELERAKHLARHRIYGRHYLTLADKYFGLAMNDDARRCYWAALRHRPSYALDPGIQRRLAATMIGRDRYERGKIFFKRAAARN
jgi:glycosyltransferase involved in cell wall biosynthesis